MLGLDVHRIGSPHLCISRVGAPYQHAVSRQGCIPAGVLTILDEEIFPRIAGIDAVGLVADVQRLEAVVLTFHIKHFGSGHKA